MRIILVSPHFKPMAGGVADYSFQFASELVRQGHEVVVVTRAHVREELPFTVVRRDDFGLSLAGTLKNLCLEHKVEAVLFQWTPLAFAPRSLGIVPSFALSLLFLRAIPVHIMVHESHYPVLFNLRGFLIGLPHFIQFILFSFFAHKLFFSHIAALEYWAKRLPHRSLQDLQVLPVSSNIPVVKNDASQVRSHRYQLVYFGGQHPTNDLDLVRETYDFCRQELGEEVVLKLIGIRDENCPSFLKDDGIEALGYLSEKDVSLTLQSSDLLIIPFTDGVSTRRGSLMAGLDHGLAVVTTDGICTQDDIPWSEIVILNKQGDRQAFKRNSLKALKDEVERKAYSDRGKSYYLANFAPSCTVSNYLNSFRL